MRGPPLTGYGLEEELGIENPAHRAHQRVPVNHYPNIYAAGDDVADLTSSPMWPSHQAWYMANNALFGDFKKRRRLLCHPLGDSSTLRSPGGPERDRRPRVG
jgi:hypothetical protein